MCSKKKINPVNLIQKGVVKVIKKNSLINVVKKYRKNYLCIIFFIKKFITIIKTKILFKKLNLLKSYHYELINDKSHFVQSFQQQKKIISLNNPFFVKNKKYNKS